MKFFVEYSVDAYQLDLAHGVKAHGAARVPHFCVRFVLRPGMQISLKTLMEISLVAGLARTVLISWLCLYMIPRRLRALKDAEETLG